jgi:hypothetical protein
MDRFRYSFLVIKLIWNKSRIIEVVVELYSVNASILVHKRSDSKLFNPNALINEIAIFL